MPHGFDGFRKRTLPDDLWFNPEARDTRSGQVRLRNGPEGGLVAPFRARLSGNERSGEERGVRDSSGLDQPPEIIATR